MNQKKRKEKRKTWRGNSEFFWKFCTYLETGPIIYRLGGGGDFRGDNLIFGRTKGGIIRNWEPKRWDRWKLWKGLEGVPLKFAWKMKTLGWGGGGGGGGDRESHEKLLKVIQRGIG